MAMNRKSSGLPPSTSVNSRNKNKQTTLFQNWNVGQNVPQNQDPLNEMDDQLDEETLLAACEEWEMEETETNHSSTTHPYPPQATPLEDLPGFDVSAGNIYIYPINYPLRDYQYNIVQQALFKNTMVTLPTGLGKTFIAAVVMYNFYRWYPRGKVVFMAPTKPLVFQQIEACFNIMGIPQEDMAEMTGNMHPTERKKSWLRQRVFFLTPQVMTNDLSRRACPANDIKCVVVDEAHKALGNQAYCQVIRELSKYTSQFRVLALSATPGGDIKAVNEVLSNLLISHIEIRSEDSLDIKQYVHERKVEKIVVPLGDELKQVKEQYLQILNVFVNRLVRCRVLFCRDPETLSKFQILKSREAFRQDPPPEITAARRGPVEGDFAICMSLYHGFELLLQHGQRSLYSFLLGTVDGSKGNGRTRSELMRNSDFSNLIELLEGKYAGSMHHQNTSHNASHNSSHNSSGLFTSMASSSLRATASKVVGGCKEEEEEEEYVSSHPKMTKLKEVVLEHFNKFTSANKADAGPSTSKAPQASTRVMIFAQYRDSVQEITDMLNRHWPSIRCMSFIGQASAGKNTKGFSQKEQIRVVNEFKNGGYNTLVSTCVGEEGLDIGDVDLIVCFDAHKSPIRLVQRMGRTGRKRKGRIVMLVTEGKEAAIYDRSQYSKKGIHRALQGNSKSLHLYPCSPRMVPRGLNPMAHKMNIKVGEYRSKHKTKMAAPSSTTTTSKRKSSMGGGDITRFMQGTKPDPADDVFLTYEELAYWNLHYKVDQEEQRKAPQGTKFLSLNKKAVEEVSVPDDKELSLNAFAEWQTNKQPTHKVSHSRRCDIFVEMMEFFEIQGHTEDEDIYGAEMALYLDEGDVLRPKGKMAGKEGILRYCSQEGKKNDKKDVAILDEEGDFNQTDITSKSKKGVKGKKKGSKAKSMSSEAEQLGSDDDLPVVDLFSEPSERQDENSERTGKHKSKKDTNKGRKSSDDGSSSDGKAKKSRKKSRSPHDEKDSRAKRKSIPLPCDSDEDDFACDTDRRSVTPPRFLGASPRPELQQTKQHDMKEQVTESDHDGLQDEPMDTASDDDRSLLPLKPCATSTSSPSKNHQEGDKSDTSLNTSDIFLSCSQVFKAPEVPSTLGATRKEKTLSESTHGDGEDDLMPPPPPSLSGLDLLDDIDLSFNASQLAREDTWQRTSPKKELHTHEIDFVSDKPDIVLSFRMSDKGSTELGGEAEEQNTRTRCVSSEILFGAVQNEATADFSSEVTHSRTDDIDAEFGDVIPDSDEIGTEEQLNWNTGAIADTQIVDEVHTNIQKCLVRSEETGEIHGKLSLQNKPKMEGDTQMAGKSILQHTVDGNGDEEESKNITDELVEAWDNFEGDIFDDDDDDDMDLDQGHAANILAKSPVISGESMPNAGRIHDFKNSSIAFKPLVADSEGTDQIVSAGLKMSTASHSIKPFTHSVPPDKELSNNSKQDIVTLQRKKSSVEGEQHTRSAATYTPGKGKKLIKSQPQLEHTSIAENEVKPMQQPRFDLDFDFGDFFDMDDEAFDEIGIVPPSPQVSQKRSGFMAMSQVSQSRIRPEICTTKNHNTSTTPSIKPKVVEKPELKPQGNPCDQNQVSPSREAVPFDNKNHVKHSVLDESKSSKMEGQSSSLGRFKRNLMQSVKPKDLQETQSMAQKSKGRASTDGSKKPCVDTTEKINNPPAASTPVLPDTNRDGLRHQVSTVSPIEQSDKGDIKQYDTPSSHLQKAHPKETLRSRRLSIKRKDGVAPKNSSLSSVQKQSSRPAGALPGKRKSCPLIEEGHFEDTSVSNPLKKPKTSSEQVSGLSAGNKEVYNMKPFVGHGVGKMAEKDDIDLLLEDLDWEDSLVVDVTLTKSGKQNSGLENKRDSTGTTTSKTGTHSDDDDDDDSDDIIGRVTKKKRAVVLVSPDTPQTFKTPLRSSVTPVSFKKKYVHVLSDDDSDDASFIVQPKKRKAKKILDMSCSIIIPEGVEDDDFEAPVKQIVPAKPENIHREHRRDDIPLKQRLEMKERRNKPKKSSNYHHAAAHFLDEEAEVSEDEECSSDEENSDLDNSLEGFINNASQCSQTTCPQDMHAIYMKSVRSPSVAGPSTRFKMVHRHSPDLNVFSQVPQQDASYMEDSFVVQGGEEDDDDTTEIGEDISLVAMDNTINLDNIVDGGSRRKGGRRLRNRGGESKAARILRAGRAAVLKSDSSLSDMEEAAEDDDLMDWETDFEVSRKTNQKKQQSNWGSSAKGRLLGDHRRLGKANVNSKTVSSKPPSSDWMSKPKTDTQPFKVNTKEVHAFKEKEKSPLKMNYALMNSGRISEGTVNPDRPVSKPCTFVAPQPAAPSSSSLLVSPKTLAQREKEERLRRQKQKQAEFLQKLQQKQAQTSSQASDISPVKKTSLSSWSHRKEEGIDEKTATHHKLSSASSGLSNPRSDFPNSEGFEVPGSSAHISSSMKSGSTNKGESGTIMNQKSGSRLVSSTCTPRVSSSNKTLNNLTMMDSSVANATMSATAVNSSVLNPRSSASAGQVPLVILVDSKELSSAPHMVSTLTITHGLNPIVSQLQGCDYVTSTRMGVEKRTLSEFSNGSNRQKLLDRVRHMCELFDRPCLIIEKDREKNRDKRQPPKTLIRTKYLDATLAALTKTHVKILFSDSTEETAQILADLAKIESRKGAAIPHISDMDSKTEQVLKFYQSIPSVSYVTALSLLHHYSTVEELLSTCESILQSRIKVSSVRAKQIMTYINHHFDEQMTGSR